MGSEEPMSPQLETPDSYRRAQSSAALAGAHTQYDGLDVVRPPQGQGEH